VLRGSVVGGCQFLARFWVRHCLRYSLRACWGLSFGLVSGGMLGLSAGAAGAEIMECRLRRGHGINGLIAPQYIFDHTRGAVAGQVYDGLIHQEMRRPQVAGVREDSARLFFRWQVRVKDHYGNPVDVDFRATLVSDGTVTVKAQINGEVLAEGEGLCALP